MICFNVFFYIYSNFLTLYKRYEWSICIGKFHPFLFLKSHTIFRKFSLVKYFMEKPFLISSLVEFHFVKVFYQKIPIRKYHILSLDWPPGLGLTVCLLGLFLLYAFLGNGELVPLCVGFLFDVYFCRGSHKKNTVFIQV